MSRRAPMSVAPPVEAEQSKRRLNEVLRVGAENAAMKATLKTSAPSSTSSTAPAVSTPPEFDWSVGSLIDKPEHPDAEGVDKEGADESES